MRIISMLFLLVFLSLITAFVMQNNEDVMVRLFDWTAVTSLAGLAVIVYLLGMLSGWAVLGMLRRSVQRLTAPGRNTAPR